MAFPEVSMSQLSEIISGSKSVPTASYALFAQTTSGSIESASYALSASYADNAGSGGGVGFWTSSDGGIERVGDVYVTGTLHVTIGITGSLFGTASNAVSASYANTASYVENAQSASYSVTASYAETGDTIGGFVTQSFTNEPTWSFAHNLGVKYPSFEIFDTSDKVMIPGEIIAIDANNADIYFSVTESGLVTATFGGQNVETASWALNSITASHLVGSIESASYSLSSSYSDTAQTLLGSAVSASYALTASYAENASADTASWALNAISSSYSDTALTASVFSGSVDSSSYSLTSETASYYGGSVESSSYALSSSYSDFAITASYVSGSSSVSASYALSSSYSDNVISSSYAVTASYAENTDVLLFAGGFATQSFTNEPTWSFTHNLGSQYVSFEIYGTSSIVIIPDKILAVDTNNADIYFPVSKSGIAIATFGGNVSTASYLLGSIESASYALTASYITPEAGDKVLMFAISDETTAFTASNTVFQFRMPYDMTFTTARANVNIGGSSDVTTFDINQNGSTVLSTKITIDTNESSSFTAAAQPVIASASLFVDDLISIDIDIAATGSKGGKITMIGS